MITFITYDTHQHVIIGLDYSTPIQYSHDVSIHVAEKAQRVVHS